MAQYLIGNIKGPKGDDGFSPKATVTQTSTGATITVEDADGITTANIRNGVDADGDPIDLTGYATKEELQDVEDKIPSLDGYATTAFVNEVVPSKLSELENDVDFVVGTNVVRSVNGMTGDVVIDIEGGGDPFVESDPTVPAWAKSPVKPTYGWTEIVDKPFDTLGEGLSVENGVLNATASGGATYTAGAGIDITDDEISVDNTVALKTDIPDVSGFVEAEDLATVATSGSYTDLSNTPTIPTIPTNVSAFTNDAGYITSYTETDPVFTASPAYGITTEDIDTWDNKSDFSGDYNDLTNKPTIPDISGLATTDALTAGLATKQDVLTAGTGINITNNVISATGGGSGGSYTWTDDVFVANSFDATGLADLITEYASGKVYPIIYCNRYYYKLMHIVDYSTSVTNPRIVYQYFGMYPAVQSHTYPYQWATITFAPDPDRSFISANITNYSIPEEARGLKVSSGDSVTGAASNVGLNFQYIKNNYALKTEVSAKQDALTAGDGITIENNVISASGGSSSINVDGVSIIDDNGTYKTAIGGGTIERPTVDYLVNGSGTTTQAIAQDSYISEQINFSTPLPVGTYDVTYTIVNHDDSDASTTITTTFESENNGNSLYCTSGGLGSLGFWIGNFWMTGSGTPYEGIGTVAFQGTFTNGANVEITGCTISANGTTYLDNQTITFTNGAQPGSQSIVPLTSSIPFTQTLVGPGYDDNDLTINLSGTVTVKNRNDNDSVVATYSFTDEPYKIQGGGAPVFYYDGNDYSHDYILNMVLCSVSSRDQDTGAFNMTGISGVQLQNGSPGSEYYAELTGLAFSLGGSETQYINPDFLPLGDNLYVQDGRVHANGAPTYDGHLVIYDTNHENGWYLTTDGNTITLNPCPWNN